MRRKDRAQPLDKDTRVVAHILPNKKLPRAFAKKKKSVTIERIGK